MSRSFLFLIKVIYTLTLTLTALSLALLPKISARALTMKVFVVQFSNSGTDAIKIKMPVNSERLVVSEVEEFLRSHCPVDVEVESFEFYNSVSEKFEAMETFDVLSNGVRLYPVLAKVKGSGKEVPLQIEGRAFDISGGLFIGDRALKIQEQVNRSEGTGLNTWDGSVVLAKFLEKHRHVVHSKRVLEVGSGTGVSGLAAAYLGASLSVLTDLAYTLENLQANIALNYCAADTKSNSIDNKPIVHALDWTDVTTYVSPADFNQLDTLSRPDNVDGGADNSWDVILGADVVWLEELVEPLVTALRSLCSPQTIVLLSHQKRSEHTDSALFSYLREFFTVTQVDRHTLNEEFSSPKINIFKCQLKPSTDNV